MLPALPACRGREVGNSCRSTSRSGHVTSRRPRAGRRAIEAERSRAGSTSEGSRTKRTQANEQNHLPFSCTLVRRDPHAEEATHTHTHNCCKPRNANWHSAVRTPTQHKKANGRRGTRASGNTRHAAARVVTRLSVPATDIHTTAAATTAWPKQVAEPSHQHTTIGRQGEARETRGGADTRMVSLRLDPRHYKQNSKRPSRHGACPASGRG